MVDQGAGYLAGFAEYGLILGGALLRYSSVVAGIYSICGDEQDTSFAIVGGAGYLLGVCLQQIGIDRGRGIRLGKLEGKVKGEPQGHHTEQKLST